jgi:hypothetical protein
MMRNLPHLQLIVLTALQTKVMPHRSIAWHMQQPISLLPMHILQIELSTDLLPFHSQQWLRTTHALLPPLQTSPKALQTRSMPYCS